MFRNLSTSINLFTRNPLKYQRFLHASATKYEINSNVAKYRLHNATEGFYWQSQYEKITVPDFTLDEYLWKNILKWENKIAIVSEEKKKYLKSTKI